MRIGPSTSLESIAFLVCTALDRVGIQAILTGGSAATVYAASAYQSADLDFVVQFRPGQGDATEALAALGYKREGDLYRHSENPLFLEFPPGPLTIGGDLVHEWDTLRKGDQLLHILTPTDSCRDRLAGFLFWNDRGSLAQAVAVARAQRTRVTLDEIRSWCERESRLERYLEFERAMRRPRST